ncbi:MAG: transmembrane 220 family protein, partial [Ferruginibacter sp.]
MKYFNILFIGLFIVAAALQYNDPDPWLWMPIYLYAAVLCFLAVKKKYNSKLYIIGLIFYGCYAAYLLIDKTGVLNWANEHQAESIVHTMKATKPWIEET